VFGIVAVVQDTGGQAPHTEPVDWVRPWETAQSAAGVGVSGTQARVVVGTQLIMEVGTEATLPGMVLALRSWPEVHPSTPEVHPSTPEVHPSTPEVDQSMTEVSTWAYSVEDAAMAHQ
jgi:hypothetical protein